MVAINAPGSSCVVVEVSAFAAVPYRAVGVDWRLIGVSASARMAVDTARSAVLGRRARVGGVLGRHCDDEFSRVF